MRRLVSGFWRHRKAALGVLLLVAVGFLLLGARIRTERHRPLKIPKKAVISLATDYVWADMRNFVVSLRYSGFDVRGCAFMLSNLIAGIGRHRAVCVTDGRGTGEPARVLSRDTRAGLIRVSVFRQGQQDVRADAGAGTTVLSLAESAEYQAFSRLCVAARTSGTVFPYIHVRCARRCFSEGSLRLETLSRICGKAHAICLSLSDD